MDLSRAVQHLHSGGLVAFPTETVYGLGGDATSAAAVQRIFEMKGRPTDHPLIVHLAETKQISHWAVNLPPALWSLAEAFWPGPLTVILSAREDINRTVTGGLPTIALRVPSHPVASELLHAFGKGIAAPSANRFGRVSPTQAQHVRDEFAGIDASELMILDGGSCQVGLESTIIDLSRSRPALLRPGAITREMLQEVLGTSPADPDEHSPQVSGSLPSHYAPQAGVRIFRANEQSQMRAALAEAAERGHKIAVISADGDGVLEPAIWLAAPADATFFAQTIYALMRQGDELAADSIFVVPPDELGIGEAIWDRLRKAAAPRQ